MNTYICRGRTASGHEFGHLPVDAERPADAAGHYTREVYRLHGVHLQYVDVGKVRYLVSLTVEVKARPLYGHSQSAERGA